MPNNRPFKVLYHSDKYFNIHVNGKRKTRNVPFVTLKPAYIMDEDVIQLDHPYLLGVRKIF